MAQPQLDRPLRPAEAPLLLRERMLLPYEPQQAYFILEYPDGDSVKVPAMVLAPFSSGAGAERSWQFGAWYEPKAATGTVRIAVVAVGIEGKIDFRPFREASLQELRAKGASVDELRAVLLRRKEVLRSWDIQLEEQGKILQRLRADAEVIGGVGRIIDAQDEKQRLELEITSIDGQIVNLNRLVELARSRPVPKNLSRREQQLSSQLVQLAAAAKEAERGEGQRRGEAERTLQQKLTLVEETRNEDIDLLRRELQALQAERSLRQP